MRFGDRWKTHSKMFTTHFRFGNISSYHTTQRDCTYDLLRDLLESPQNLHDHLKQYVYIPNLRHSLTEKWPYQSYGKCSDSDNVWDPCGKE